MQFNFDPEIKGDLEVKARGTESLMANEVRSQRLMGFLQVASNPALAPFAKFDYIIREIAKAMDLDPEKVTNDMREAAIQAELLKEFRGQQPQEQPQQQPPAGANPLDPSSCSGRARFYRREPRWTSRYWATSSRWSAISTTSISI